MNADGYVSTGQGVLGHNMFAYCGNNPVMRCDFTGQGWIIVALCVLGCLVLTGCTKQPSQSTSSVSPSPKPSKPGSSTSELTPAQQAEMLIVAQTIYGEEHGRTNYEDWQQGQQAIAHVILNRKNAQLSYLGKDLTTICTNGQFDGYFAGKKAYETNGCDAIAWDSAMSLAQSVVTGETLGALEGITSDHLYFNASATYNSNISCNGGKFSFGPGTTLVTPKGVVQYGGNTFFYY